MRRLKMTYTKVDDSGPIIPLFDVPGHIWSLIATPLLRRRVLTPHQARQVEAEKARIRLLRRFFPMYERTLAQLAKELTSAAKDLRTLNSPVLKIKSALLTDSSVVSLSRDLITQADAHPHGRFMAILGLREQERADLRTREGQLELLTATSDTMTVTLRELKSMAKMILKMRYDVKNIMKTLRKYEAKVKGGEVKEYALLEELGEGLDQLMRERVDYSAREQKRHEKRRSEMHNRRPKGGM